MTDFDGFPPVMLTDSLNWNISLVVLMIIGDSPVIYTTQRDTQGKKINIFCINKNNYIVKILAVTLKTKCTLNLGTYIVVEIISRKAITNRLTSTY